MYRNRKGKRRVRLTLTGKEARWLYAVAYAEPGGTKTPEWTAPIRAQASIAITASGTIGR